MDDKIKESLEKNKTSISTPSIELKNEGEFSANEEKLEGELRYTKLQEDSLDAEHSLKNTLKLNNIYSQLINIFFGGWWFYIWTFILFALFIIKDEDFINIFYSKETARKTFYALTFMFIMLLSFPTAKGIRNFFRNFINRIKK